MLKKKYRLGSKEKIEINKSYSSDYFLLRIGRNNLAYARFRFVVSKKIDKRAVVRNKIRRLFSKCVESFLSEIKEGYDLIFIVKRNVVNITEEEICLSIKKALGKEGLLNQRIDDRKY